MSEEPNTPVESVPEPPEPAPASDDSPFELPPQGQQMESPLTQVNPDESPFVLPPIEGLPLTKDERAELRRVIEEFDRERAASAASTSR